MAIAAGATTDAYEEEAAGADGIDVGAGDWCADVDWRADRRGRSMMSVCMWCDLETERGQGNEEEAPKSRGDVADRTCAARVTDLTSKGGSEMRIANAVGVMCAMEG